MIDDRVLFVTACNPTLKVTHPSSPHGISLQASMTLDVEYTGEDFHAAHRYANGVLSSLEELICFSGLGWEAVRDRRGVYQRLGQVDLPVGVVQANFYIGYRGFELHYVVYYIRQPLPDEQE